MYTFNTLLKWCEIEHLERVLYRISVWRKWTYSLTKTHREHFQPPSIGQARWYLVPRHRHSPAPLLSGFYAPSHFAGQLSVSVRKCRRQSAYKGESFVGVHRFRTPLLLSLGWGCASWYGTERKALRFIGETWKKREKGQETGGPRLLSRAPAMPHQAFPLSTTARGHRVRCRSSSLRALPHPDHNTHWMRNFSRDEEVQVAPLLPSEALGDSGCTWVPGGWLLSTQRLCGDSPKPGAQWDACAGEMEGIFTRAKSKLWTVLLPHRRWGLLRSLVWTHICLRLSLLSSPEPQD